MVGSFSTSPTISLADFAEPLLNECGTEIHDGLLALARGAPLLAFRRFLPFLAVRAAYPASCAVKVRERCFSAPLREHGVYEMVRWPRLPLT
jgi:hypothetical protein